MANGDYLPREIFYLGHEIPIPHRMNGPGYFSIYKIKQTKIQYCQLFYLSCCLIRLYWIANYVVLFIKKFTCYNIKTTIPRWGVKYFAVDK